MENAFVEKALFVPLASRRMLEVRKIAQLVRMQFPSKVMAGMRIVGSPEKNAVGMFLEFHPETYHPDKLKWLDVWIEKLEMEVVEVDAMDVQERRLFLAEFNSYAPASIETMDDIEQTITAIEEKFIHFHGLLGGEKESTIKVKPLGKFVSA